MIEHRNPHGTNLIVKFGKLPQNVIKLNQLLNNGIVSQIYTTLSVHIYIKQNSRRESVLKNYG